MRGGNLSPTAKIAYCAVCCATLIAGQVALGAVSGVEIVTVLLLCFSAYFGAAFGAVTAIIFSLLRCLIWGFYPAVIALYLIYYPLFAVLFGRLGAIKDEKFNGRSPVLAVAVNLSFCAVAIFCGLCAGLKLIKFPRPYETAFTVLLWVIFGICAALLISFDVIYALSFRREAREKILKLYLFTACACLCTVCFTLLDDVITPLFFQMTAESATAYFYASFTAMLPQTVCTLITVSTLYYPVTAALKRACPCKNKSAVNCIDKPAGKL